MTFSPLLRFLVGILIALVAVTPVWNAVRSYPEVFDWIVTQAAVILGLVGFLASGLAVVLLGTKAYWKGHQHLLRYGLSFFLVITAIACFHSVQPHVSGCVNCVEAHMREGPFERLRCCWNGPLLSTASIVLLPPGVAAFCRRIRAKAA